MQQRSIILWSECPFANKQNSCCFCFNSLVILSYGNVIQNFQNSNVIKVTIFLSFHIKPYNLLPFQSIFVAQLQMLIQLPKFFRPSLRTKFLFFQNRHSAHNTSSNSQLCLQFYSKQQSFYWKAILPYKQQLKTYVTVQTLWNCLLKQTSSC